MPSSSCTASASSRTPVAAADAASCTAEIGAAAEGGRGGSEASVSIVAIEAADDDAIGDDLAIHDQLGEIEAREPDAVGREQDPGPAVGLAPEPRARAVGGLDAEPHAG